MQSYMLGIAGRTGKLLVFLYTVSSALHACCLTFLFNHVSSHGPTFRAWMDAINSCTIKDHQVSISCLKTCKLLYQIDDFSFSLLQKPDGGYNITTRHDFSPEEPHSFSKSTLWKVLPKFVHYVVCLFSCKISFLAVLLS
jgi:hypothetical protein